MTNADQERIHKLIRTSLVLSRSIVPLILITLRVLLRVIRLAYWQIALLIISQEVGFAGATPSQ